MTHHSAEDLGAMSPDTTALLERSRAWDAVDPAFDDEACERVLAGVEALVGPPPEGGGASGAQSPGAPRTLRRVAALAFVAAGLLGVAGGGLLLRPERHASAPVMTAVTVQPAPPTPDVTIAAPGPALTSVDVMALPSAAQPSTTKHELSPEGSSVAAELRLTTAARTALAAGDAPSALHHLDEHEQRFPGGQLAQERDNLRIQALIASGDASAARLRAASFRARYPQGLLLPSVERALAPRDD